MKINYLFSGVNEDGFNAEQENFLKRDIVNNSTITFIASNFDDYEKNDFYVEKILNYFKKININFKNYHLIDRRINELESKEYIEKSDVVYLLGGSPELQMKLIDNYNLKSIIKNRNGITIGVSAGAMNQSKRVVYKDEYQDNKIFDYEGIGIIDITIYPHLDINNLDYLKEILEISKLVKLYVLPNDSFIRIENKSIDIIGEYYILGN